MITLSVRSDVVNAIVRSWLSVRCSQEMIPPTSTPPTEALIFTGSNNVVGMITARWTNKVVTERLVASFAASGCWAAV